MVRHQAKSVPAIPLPTKTLQKEESHSGITGQGLPKWTSSSPVPLFEAGRQGVSESEPKPRLPQHFRSRKLRVDNKARIISSTAFRVRRNTTSPMPKQLTKCSVPHSRGSFPHWWPRLKGRDSSRSSRQTPLGKIWGKHWPCEGNANTMRARAIIDVNH